MKVVEMFEYISQHWYVGVILVVLIILTAFVWYKAIISSKRHNDERDRVIARLEEEKKLRNEYRHIDETSFSEEKDNYRFITGMCAFVQMKIEKIDNMNQAFLELPESLKYAYALGYVFEDSEKKLSEFFRSNGEPLLSESREAVKRVIGGEFAELFEKEAVMLDDNDETTSVDETKLSEWNEEYKKFMEENHDKIYSLVALYIRENKADFLI